MPALSTDIWLTALWAVFALQLAWLSVWLARRGLPLPRIQAMLPPLFGLWVVFWPMYEEPAWIWAGLAVPAVYGFLAAFVPARPLRQLAAAWTPWAEDPLEPGRFAGPPLWPLLAGLGVACAWMMRAPEFGFGLALALCLAWPLAELVDQAGLVPLGFPAHPGQTLAGHLAFVVAAGLLMAWSVRVHHHLPMLPVWAATTIAAAAGSAVRGLAPGPWHRPLGVAAMGAVLSML